MNMSCVTVSPLMLTALGTSAQVQSEKTREQVKSEFAEALRAGDVLASGESGLNRNEPYPQRYAHANQGSRPLVRRSSPSSPKRCATGTWLRPARSAGSSAGRMRPRGSRRPRRHKRIGAKQLLLRACDGWLRVRDAGGQGDRAALRTAATAPGLRSEWLQDNGSFPSAPRKPTPWLPEDTGATARTRYGVASFLHCDQSGIPEISSRGAALSIGG